MQKREIRTQGTREGCACSFAPPGTQTSATPLHTAIMLTARKSVNVFFGLAGCGFFLSQCCQQTLCLGRSNLWERHGAEQGAMPP